MVTLELDHGFRPSFRVYENVLHLRPTIKRDRPCRVVDWQRGAVNGFSRASRSRLGRLLAQVQWSALPPASFVTLTWHHLSDDWLAHFRTLLQWLRRRGVRYVWRLELQRPGARYLRRERGVPHFHLILWAPDGTLDLDSLCERWHEIADPRSLAHAKHGAKAERLDSYRQASQYLRKYMSKCDDAAWIATTPLSGRRTWGVSRDLPTAPLHDLYVDDRGLVLLRRVAKRLLRSRRRSRTFGGHWGAHGMWLHVSQSTMAHFARVAGENFFAPDHIVDASGIDWDAAMWQRPPPPEIVVRPKPFLQTALSI